MVLPVLPLWLVALGGYAVGRGKVPGVNLSTATGVPIQGGAPQPQHTVGLAPGTAQPNRYAQWDLVCPVDATISDVPDARLGGMSARAVVYDAWNNASVEQLEALAQGMKVDYPVAASSLVERAFAKLRAAQKAAPAVAVTASEGKGKGLVNGEVKAALVAAAPEVVGKEEGA